LVVTETFNSLRHSAYKARSWDFHHRLLKLNVRTGEDRGGVVITEP
jgi:hypothetical protein